MPYKETRFDDPKLDPVRAALERIIDEFDAAHSDLPSLIRKVGETLDILFETPDPHTSSSSSPTGFN